MSGIEVKNFHEPDETVAFDHGRVDLVRVGSMEIGREVLEPGWRWSTHVKPIAGTDWCEFHHGDHRQLPGRRRLGQGARAGRAGPDHRPVHRHRLVDVHGRAARRHGLAAPPREPRRGRPKPPRAPPRARSEDDGRRLPRDLRRARPGDPLRARHRASSAKLGIEIRAGLHTGEVEVSGGDVRGVAVHLASRIMSAAEPGTVMISATSRELASGTGIEFIDRGRRAFKGIDGPRQVYEARLPGS